MPESHLNAAATDVLAERHRQITLEGWSPEHDDKHADGALARAGAAYALMADRELHLKREMTPGWWPWAAVWWKPKDRRADLVRAGALILAEIERLDRASPPQQRNHPGAEIAGDD
jgi:hypothetical protein